MGPRESPEVRLHPAANVSHKIDSQQPDRPAPYGLQLPIAVFGWGWVWDEPDPERAQSEGAEAGMSPVRREPGPE